MLLLYSIFSFVICTAWSQEEKITLAASPAVILEMRQNAEICGKQLDVDPNALKKMATWTLPRDEAHKKFLQCVCVRSGYIDEEGFFNVDKMLNFVTEDGSSEDFKIYLENCNKNKSDNYLDTVYDKGVCLHARYKFVLNKAQF